MQTNQAGILSELLMCSTTLGAGVIPPFDIHDQGGMIFVSAVSDEFKTTMRKAAAAFGHAAAGVDTALRRRVHNLEADVAADTPGALRELEEAREQLDMMNYPFCHDHSASKDMVLELVSKSRHKHVTIMDDYGFRLSMSLKYSAKFASESALLSMTALGMDQALVRGHGSGKLFWHNISGNTVPVFTYFSAPPPELTQKLANKLATNTLLSPLRGHAVIVSEPPQKQASIGVTQQDIIRLLNTYYTLGHKRESDRARFSVASPSLDAKWRRFLTGDDIYQILGVEEARLDRADRVLGQWHIKPAVAAAFATRAALCCAVIDNTGDPMSIPLGETHYNLAVELFKELFRGFMKRVQAGSKLAENAALARLVRSSATPSPARQEAAVESLMDAINASPHRMVSRDAAIRLPKVTAALLDYLVENRSEFVELKGKDISNMGRTKRAYALRDEVSSDLGEALDDLGEAEKVYEENPKDPMFDSMETVRHELMRMAAAADRKGLIFGLPAVPITSMSSTQLRCLPAILKEYPESFAMRGTPDSPELPHLVKSTDDPDAPLEPGVPVVWVRRGVDGNELRDWRMASRLGFADVWK